VYALAKERNVKLGHTWILAIQDDSAIFNGQIVHVSNCEQLSKITK